MTRRGILAAACGVPMAAKVAPVVHRLPVYRSEMSLAVSEAWRRKYLFPAMEALEDAIAQGWGL